MSERNANTNLMKINVNMKGEKNMMTVWTLTFILELFRIDLWLFPWPIFDQIKKVWPRLLDKEASEQTAKVLNLGSHQNFKKNSTFNFYAPMLDLIGRYWRLSSFQSISFIINERKEQNFFNQKSLKKQQITLRI